MITEDIKEQIRVLEEIGSIDPDCNYCHRIFYPQLLEGKRLFDIFAPRHKASNRCESGKHPHCTCDTCF